MFMLHRTVSLRFALLDRKSTRLNSSHSQISYAVFCLKKTLATSWVVYDQELKESFCTLQEGGVPPGQHRVLRFTVTTPHIGDADVALCDPIRHDYPNG